MIENSANAAIKQVLIAARALIANPANWTQRALARTANGDECHEYDPHATCYCGTGALYKVGVLMPSPLFQHLGVFIGCVNQSIPSYNDTHTHEEVLALFDKSIAACDTVELLNPPYWLQKPTTT